MPEETIRIVTYDIPGDSPQPTASEGAKSGMDVGQHLWYEEVQPDASKPQKVEQERGPLKLHDVSVPLLKRELAGFMKTVDQLFSGAEQQANMQLTQLEEVELSVEINGEGQVSLLGSGTKVGSKSGITLKFKRRTRTELLQEVVEARHAYTQNNNVGRRSVSDLLEEPRKSLTSLIGSGKGSFATPEEADRFIRQERDAWPS